MATENMITPSIHKADIAVAKDFFTIRLWPVFPAIKYSSLNINPCSSIYLMGGNLGQRLAKA